MIIIGDVHGRYDLLEQLINSLPHDNLCFVGDLIDRGPESSKVVSLVIEKGYKCVLGNHEQFMVESYTDELKRIEPMYDLWLKNGAQATINSYTENGVFNEELFFAHREWMETLPWYYWAVPNRVVVSHSYYLPYIGMPLTEDVGEEILWGRDVTAHKTDFILNVHGHTIIEGHPTENDGYLNIDTGAAYKGILTAYDTDTGNIYSAF